MLLGKLTDLIIPKHTPGNYWNTHSSPSPSPFDG